MPPSRFHAAQRQLEDVASHKAQPWHSRFGHRAAAGISVAIIVVGGAVATAALVPTKGPIPTSKSGVPEISKAPDFISVIVSDKVVGYAPRQDLILPSSGPPPAGFGSTPIPVFGADLQTLIGHMYPGIGFVALGQSPQSVACTPEGGIPCQTVSVTLPNVVGMSTPTAAGELSGLGVLVNVVNTSSATAPGGTIVSMTPAPGSDVFARSTVTIYNSLGP